jgi:exonuclease III
MNWNHKYTKKQILASTKHAYDNYSIAFTDNQFNPPKRSSYLPGGCLQLCTGHWTSRIIETIKDPRRLGRWTGHKFRLRDGKTLSIITAYRPCQQSVTDATQPSVTVTYQQKVILTREKWTDEDPRQLFITDIIKVIKDIEEDSNNLCVLMWDANKSMDDKSGSIKKIMKETMLVDSFSQIAGDPGTISTYSRGRKRIDYILTSQALVQHILRVGYLALYESNLSDHRGMFIDITESILDTKVTLSKPTNRHIGSKSKKDTIYKYKQYIHHQFIIHRIYERSNEIKKLAAEGKVTQELLRKLNTLDKQITEIMLAAERNQCPKQHETEWSVVIHHQAQLCRYWALIVKGTKNRIDTKKQAREVFQQLPEEMQSEIQNITQYHHPMTTQRECNRQLRLARKYHRQLLKTHRDLRHQGLLCLKEIRASEGNLTAAEIIR